MSTLEKLSELESRRTAIVVKHNEEAKKVAFAKGKLTARDRIINYMVLEYSLIQQHKNIKYFLEKKKNN